MVFFIALIYKAIYHAAFPKMNALHHENKIAQNKIIQ